jgi:hypothetical protein
MSHTGSHSRMPSLAKNSRNFKQQTLPLIKKGVPHLEKTKNLTVKLVWAPKGGLTLRQSGRLTVGRNS